jgi:hypothetical protein
MRHRAVKEHIQGCTAGQAGAFHRLIEEHLSMIAFPGIFPHSDS